MKGIVEFFNNVKGLGFLIGPSNTNDRYFVHESDILMSGFRTLLSGWEVEFEAKKMFQKGLACGYVRPPGGLAGLKKGQKEGNPRLADGVVKMMVDSEFKPSFPEVQEKTTRYVAAATFTAYYTGEVVVGKILELEMSLPAQSSARVTLLLDPEKHPRRFQEDGQYKHVANGSYVLAATSEGQVGLWCIGRRYQPFNVDNGENWLVLEQRFIGHIAPSFSAEDVRKQLPTSGLKRDNDGFAKGIARAFELLL